MSCCAVGICAMTDLNSEKNSVATSNSPGFEHLDDLLADLVRVLEVLIAHPGRAARQCSRSRLEIAAKLVVALLADRQDLHRLAGGDQTVGVMLARADDRGIERAAQTALGGRRRVDARRPCRSRREAAKRRSCPRPSKRGCPARSPCARRRARGGGRRLRAAQLRAATICMALVIFCVALTPRRYGCACFF